MTMVLGIDPGLSSTGWGVIKSLDKKKNKCVKNNCINNEYEFVDCGILKTDTQDNLGNRLVFIYDSILKLIRMFRPDKISIERVFVNVNPASSEKLIMARTAAVLAITKAGHKCIEFAPNVIKKVITGLGHGSKEIVKAQVQKLLHFDGVNCHCPKTADASDALAIALCAVISGGEKNG